MTDEATVEVLLAAAGLEPSAAEIAIYAQFSPAGGTVKDLVARMEDLWKVAKG